MNQYSLRLMAVTAVIVVWAALAAHPTFAQINTNCNPLCGTYTTIRNIQIPDVSFATPQPQPNFPHSLNPPLLFPTQEPAPRTICDEPFWSYPCDNASDILELGIDEITNIDRLPNFWKSVVPPRSSDPSIVPPRPLVNPIIPVPEIPISQADNFLVGINIKIAALAAPALAAIGGLFKLIGDAFRALGKNHSSGKKLSLK